MTRVSEAPPWMNPRVWALGSAVGVSVAILWGLAQQPGFGVGSADIDFGRATPQTPPDFDVTQPGFETQGAELMPHIYLMAGGLPVTQEQAEEIMMKLMLGGHVTEAIHQSIGLLVLSTSDVEAIQHAVKQMNEGVPADEAVKNLSRAAQNAMYTGNDAKLNGRNIVITDLDATRVVKYFGGIPDVGERMH